MELRKKIMGMLLISVLTINCCFATEAYLFNGWTFSNPLNIKFKVGSSITQYTSKKNTYSKKWNNCPELSLSSTSSSENIYFQGELSHNNGAYGKNVKSSANHRGIILYALFQSATDTQKNETIVHEVGHALGLAHCEDSDMTRTVMRATGFNLKAYPLSDDKAAISVKYY